MLTCLPVDIFFILSLKFVRVRERETFPIPFQAFLFLLLSSYSRLMLQLASFFSILCLERSTFLPCLPLPANSKTFSWQSLNLCVSLGHFAAMPREPRHGKGVWKGKEGLKIWGKIRTGDWGHDWDYPAVGITKGLMLMVVVELIWLVVIFLYDTKTK